MDLSATIAPLREACSSTLAPFIAGSSQLRWSRRVDDTTNISCPHQPLPHRAVSPSSRCFAEGEYIVNN